MKSKREQFEDALIEVLSARLLKARNPDSGYLAYIRTYEGEMDRFEGPEDFREALGDAGVPAVLIGAVDGKYRTRSATRRRFDKTNRVGFMIFCGHERSQEARARVDAWAETDPTADPGAYRIEEDLWELLAGEDLGVDGFGQLIPVSEGRLFSLPDMLVWHAVYEVTHDAHKSRLDHGPGKYSSYKSRTNLEPEEDVTEPPNPFAESSGSLTE